jgi:uncharacterized membrane protein YedE/YeeE
MEIFDNLNWLVYGILIGLFVPATLLIGNKQFGISSSMQNICSVIFPKTKSIFTGYDFKNHDWKLYFVIGIAIGGFFAANIFSELPVTYLPEHYYTFEGLLTLFAGGLLVGFGTRYAGGCTSGHSITGLSFLKLSSLIATISFFIGGLIYTFLF